jgi:hypothetical protein
MRYALAFVYIALMPFLLLAAAVYNLVELFYRPTPQHREQHLPRREPAE